MSTPENSEKSTETQSPLNLGAAILSFILPGTGQFFQGRPEASVGHLLLYGLSAILPYSAIYFFWVVLSPILRDGITPWFLLMPLPMLMTLFSALDAAYWKPCEPSRMRRPVRTLAIVIVCVFLALLLILPMICAAREAARRMQCTSNLKQIALAMHFYHDKYKTFPPAYTVDGSGKPLHSWRVLLLPYFDDEKQLYDEIRLNEPWDSEYNRQFHSRVLGTYQCPSDKYSGIRGLLGRRFPKILHGDLNCTYSVVVGKQTIFPGSKPTKLSDISDGTSNTILIVERIFPVCWMDPTHEITFNDACLGINASVYGPGSGHTGGCNMVMADGSVQYFSETIVPEALKAALTKAGGETVSGW